MMRVFENRVLRGMFGTRRDGVTGVKVKQFRYRPGRAQMVPGS